MKTDKIGWESIEKVLDELVESQRKQLLILGRRTIPRLTADDVLQPNDYPELEFDPQFRYEEGMLAGIQTVQTALKFLRRSIQ
ncbi:MAG TPA: hypothetical protein VIH61_02705 [Waddliaceae bacterium]